MVVEVGIQKNRVAAASGASSPRSQRQQQPPPQPAQQPLPFPLARTWGRTQAPPVCRHVLLAEFDIDRGCTMRHQHPAPVPGGQGAADALAELMLPEGVHQRQEDSLWFFLNREGPMLMLQSDSAASGGSDSSKGDRFLYGFNLVGTRQDAAIRRGAKVMALAVLSPYPFIQPLAEAAMARALEECLLLGGGQEQGGSYAGVLRRLWACVNEFDVGTLPRPSEAERALMRRGVAPRSVNALEACGGRHYRPEAWVHRAQLAWQPAPSTSPTGPVPLPITLPLHASGPDDILPPSSSSSSQPPPILTLLRTFGPDGVARIYRALLHGQRTLFVGHGHAAAAVARLVLAAAALLAPPLQGLLRRVFPYVTLSDLRFLETPGGFVAGTTNPVFARREEWYDLLCVLPPAAANSAAGEAGGAKGGAKVGRCFAPGERTADEGNSGGGGHSSSSSSSSSSSRQQQRAASPVTGASFSLVGALAPLSPTRAATAPGGGGSGGGGGKGGGGDGDAGGVGDGEAEAEVAMRAVLKAFLAASVATTGGEDGEEEKEEGLRAFFRLHGQALLELAWDGTSPVHNGRAREGSRKFARANAQRVRALRRLPEFAHANPDPWQGLQPPLPVPGTTLRSHLRLLATHALLDEVELERIFLDLSNALHTPESLLVLVAWLPEGEGSDGGGGGLLRLAAALFHENQHIRFHAALLLERLRACPATLPALRALNPLLLDAHRRVLEEMMTG